MYVAGLSPFNYGTFINFIVAYIKDNNIYIKGCLYEGSTANYLKFKEGLYLIGEIIENSDFLGFDKYGNFHIPGEVIEEGDILWQS